MSDTEKRLEKALISAVEKWAEEGCATAEGMEALAAVAQVLINLRRN